MQQFAPTKPKWYNTNSGRVMIVIFGFIAVIAAVPVWNFLTHPRVAPDKVNSYAVLNANSHVFSEPRNDAAVIETTAAAGVIYIVRETTGLEYYERAGGGWVSSASIHFYSTERDALVALGQAAPAQVAPVQQDSGFSGDLPVVGYWPCQQGQIKGNKLSMIYHVPSGESYSVTSRDVACFNTEQEAINAGFRKAKR